METYLTLGSSRAFKNMSENLNIIRPIGQDSKKGCNLMFKDFFSETS